MKQLNCIFCIFFSLLILNTMEAQHHINAIFYDENNLSALAESEMYEGCIDKDLLLFKWILEGMDGEIQLDANDFEQSDNVFLKLVNNTTNDVYGLRLTNGKLTVEADITVDKGTFMNGDILKIVRCQNYILFFKNGKMLHTIQLADNNFAMAGGVDVISASDTLAEIWFRTL